MNAKHIFLFLLLTVFQGLHLSAQSSVSDSLWCDHLNEIIKCASIDIITDRISKDVHDSDYIAAFRPALTITGHPETETIRKEFNKVTYIGFFYSSKKIDEKLLKQFEDCYKKIKSCLAPWESARLKNRDTNLSVPDDYFITNSEDETALRIDIYHDPQTLEYQVRLHIY